jgi:type IV pilus assembly protein PilM
MAFFNLFKKKDTSVIGIDIGSSAIKVVQIHRRGNKILLDTYGALSLGPYAKQAIGRATNLPLQTTITALNDILKEAKITSHRGGIAIPFSSSFMTQIEMPTDNEKQLQTMVPIEARKYIPVPITEVSLDWSIIPKDFIKSAQSEDKSGKTDIMLVAIHNETITEFQQIIGKTGLDANFFEIEIFSTMRSVLGQNPEPIMILDIGAASTKLYIVERGGLRVSHTINKGSQDITSSIATSLNISIEQAEIMKRTSGYVKTNGEGADLSSLISFTLDYIFSESDRVMRNYQVKNNKSISKVVLVGGGAAMKGIVELATNHLKVAVETGDPFSKVEAPAVLTEVLRNNGPEFAVALGIALRRLRESE